MDEMIHNSLARLLVVHEQDQCAAGYHDYDHEVPGIGLTCQCGKAEYICAACGDPITSEPHTDHDGQDVHEGCCPTCEREATP